MNELKQANRKIRIFYLITSLDYGGTQKQLYYLLKNLPKEIEPVVISLKKHGRFKKKIEEISLLYDLSFPSQSNILNFIFFFYALLKLYFLILKFKPKVIQSFLFQANILARVIKIFFSKIKIICSERVAEKEKFWQLKIYRLTNFLVDIVVVNSLDLRNFVLKYQKIPYDKVVVIPNMMDPHEISSKEIPEKTIRELNINRDLFIILSAGRFQKQKGFDLLVEVASKFVKLCEEAHLEKKFLFLIIGDGEEEKSILKLILKNNLSNYIKLLGYKENIYDYINICNLFMLTSYWEGSPNVVLEAISSNKPVISTKVEGVKEYLKESWLISLDDKDIIENYSKKLFYLYLRHLGGNEMAAKDCLRDGFDINRYSPKEVIKKFLDLYY